MKRYVLLSWKELFLFYTAGPLHGIHPKRTNFALNEQTALQNAFHKYIISCGKENKS